MELQTHFTYTPAEKLERTELQQGDVLRRTSEIDLVLEEVHPHFHSRSKNLFFMVLTQSCDLVIRDGAGRSPYITVAPVRSLDDVLSRQIDSLRLAGVRAELPVLTHVARTKLADFVRRLLNNNEPRYFYLDASGTELPHDCCAILGLSIPLKAELHYQKCLDAKLLQLTDAFQAKLGSLVGQMFSRVGTVDWDVKQLENKVKGLTRNAAIYVPPEATEVIERAYTTATQDAPNATMSVADVSKIVRKIPKKKQQVLSRAQAVISEVLGDDPRLAKILGRLRADPAINGLLGD